MKTNKELLNVSKLTLAVQGALIAMLAMPMVAFADDSEVKTLTQPTNSIDIGAENVSAGSDKFGEYNGLNKKGVYVNGDFSIRGGDAYNSFSGGEGTKRWDLNGTDIGTTSRNFNGSVNDQGKWNLGFGFDQLRHQITDTFQTPLVGTMGGNNFTLPSNFGFINTGNAGSVASSANGQFLPKGTQILSPTQLADFNSPNVYSDRENASLTAGYNFDRQWSVKFEFNQLMQSGAKLISAGTDGTAASLTGPSGSAFGKEDPIMLMNPTNYKTDTFNLALNWAGDKGYASASLFSSIFTDSNNSVSFPHPFVSSATLLNNAQPNSQVASGGIAYPVDYLSTMPSNTFNQLNLNGGYSFTPSTKLVMGFSYGQNNQDNSYMPGAVMQTGGLPQNNLSGSVLTTNTNVKLTNQTTKDLALSASFKYNERDNNTMSSIYKWYDIGYATESAVNTPMSNSKMQVELAGDYRINQNNRVHLALEQENISRWCNSATANNGQALTAAAPAGFTGTYTANSCAQVPDSTENKFVADYKLKASDGVNLNAGYSFSKRISNLNSTFYDPLHANAQGYEKPGYVAFFDASRNEQVVKVGVNWQANDKMSLGLNGRATRDEYTESTLGVQNGHSESANMDASYNYSENSLVSVYVSWQERQRNLNNAYGNDQTVNNVWSNNMTDNSTTAGLNGKQKKMLGGKFSFSEDVVYSIDKSNYSTAIPFNFSSTRTGNTTYVSSAYCGGVEYQLCGSTPDIKSDMLRINLAGSYQIDNASKVNLGYMFQRLISTDYYYNALQYGYTPSTVMPSNQQAPGYTVTVISASYAYSF